MSTKTICNALRSAGLTKEGACGLMGNMQAESSMKSNIAQRGMTSLSDDDYTGRADTGFIDFVHDSVGYGLCQWTFYSRKQNLLDYAKKKGTSVGDEDMQVQFCLMELREYFPKVWKFLRESHDLYQCTQIVCTDYERPAVNNVSVRYKFAQEFFDQFANSYEVNAPIETDYTPINSENVKPVSESNKFFDWKIGLIQYVMQCDGYWGNVTGVKSEEFFNNLQQYLNDMKTC